MPFAPATAPAPVPGEPVVVEVPDAVLTPMNRGRIRVDPRVAGGPVHWMTGAVHDAAGRLVPESQRNWLDDDKGAPAACDPSWVPVPRRCRRLRGDWLYAGHWAHHFGHFLVEALPNLWPEPSSLRTSGLLAHQSLRGARPRSPGAGRGLRSPDLPEWQRELLRMAGYGDLRVSIVRDRPVRVDLLVVPSRPVTLQRFAHPHAVRVWRRLAESVAGSGPGAPRRIFLSRAEFHLRHRGRTRHDRSTVEWDRALEDAFRAAGFAIVTPESLPIVEQVRLVSGVGLLAGSAGSALHLSAVAPPGTRVLEIGDSRSPHRPHPTQRMIDAAAGHLTAFVPYLDVAALDSILRDSHG